MADFEIEGDANNEEAEDEFADLLDGHDSLISEPQEAVITPPVTPSALETKERFPRIRPLIDSEVKGAQDPDRTDEVTALIDDFTSEAGLETSDTTLNVESAGAKTATQSAKVTTDAEDDFGGLLEPDE